MKWHQYPWLILRTILACGWSAITYAFEGLPADKRTMPFWGKWFGFADTAPHAAPLVDAINQLKAASRSRRFHHLKDVQVEWVRLWPQRAAKLGSMVIIVQWAIILLLIVFFLIW